MRQINPFHTNIMIDSCAFDPKYSPESEASEELLNNAELNIIVTHSNLKEIEHPNTPKRVKDLARTKVYTIRQNLNQNELQVKAAIHQVLTGNGNPEKMIQDAEHVFESQKYVVYSLLLIRVYSVKGMNFKKYQMPIFISQVNYLRRSKMKPLNQAKHCMCLQR